MSLELSDVFNQAKILFDAFLPILGIGLSLTIGIGITNIVVKMVGGTAYVFPFPRQTAPEEEADPVVKLNEYNTQEPPDDLYDPYNLEHDDVCDYCSAPFNASRPRRCEYCGRVNR